MNRVTDQHISHLLNALRKFGMRTGPAAALLICLAQTAHGFLGTCSFSSTVKSGNTAFAITSSPAAGCLSQTIVIEALRNGKPAVRLISGVEYLPVDSWAADLDGDGNVELVLLSNAMDNGIFGVLDVYYFDGNLLKRATLPELSPEEQAGYSGRDIFRLENSLIVRAFPVSSGNDVAPARRRYRILRYRFDHGAITATSSGEQTTVVSLPEAAATRVKDAVVNDQPKAAVPAVPPVPVPVAGRPADMPVKTAAKPLVSIEKQALRKPVVSSITAAESFIDIRTDAPAAEYRQLLLDNPPRLAIDIPDATFSLKSGVVRLRKLGIERARIGRNSGFVRIVLDSSQPSFPRFSITRTDTGLRVSFP